MPCLWNLSRVSDEISVLLLGESSRILDIINSNGPKDWTFESSSYLEAWLRAEGMNDWKE